MRTLTSNRNKTKEEVKKLLKEANELIENQSYVSALTVLKSLITMTINTLDKDSVYKKMTANHLAAFCLYSLVKKDVALQNGEFKSDLDLNTILPKLDNAYSYCQKAIKVMCNQPEENRNSSKFKALYQETLTMQSDIMLWAATICWNYSIPTSSPSIKSVQQYTEYKENAEKSLDYFTKHFKNSLNPDRALSQQERKEITKKEEKALALCYENIANLENSIAKRKKEVNLNILEEDNNRFFPPLKRWKREFQSTEESYNEGCGL